MDIKKKLLENSRKILSLLAVTIGLISATILVGQPQILRRFASSPNGTAQVLLSPDGGSISPGEQVSVAISVNAEKIVSLDGYQLKGTLTGNIPSDIVLKPINISGMQNVVSSIGGFGSQREFSLAYVTSNVEAPLQVGDEDIVIGFLEFTAPASGDMTLAFDYDLSKVIANSGSEDILAGQGSRFFEFKDPPVFDPTKDLVIESLTLVNSDNNTDLMQLFDGQTIYLDDLPTDKLNIRANTAGPVTSVVFEINNESFAIENNMPYAIGGDNLGNYNSWTYPTGSFTVTAIAYSENGGKGDSGDRYNVRLNFVDGASPTPVPTTQPTNTPTPTPTQPPVSNEMTVTKFVLVDANKDVDIGYVEDGQVINLAQLPDSLSIRVDTQGPVNSVQFESFGNVVQTESIEPYALAGDNPQGNFNRYNFNTGQFNLVATPYSERGANGDSGRALTMNITIVDQDSQPTSTPAPTTRPTATPTTNPTSTPTPTASPTPGQFERPTLSNMRLINTTNRNVIQNITSSQTEIDKSQYPQFTLDIESGQNVGSVAFFVGGLEFNVDNTAPWSLTDNYSPWNVNLGNYHVFAVPYENSNKQGQAGNSVSVNLNVVDNGSKATSNFSVQNTSDANISVRSFDLINADTDQVIKTINNLDTISRSELNTSNLNIRANVDGDVGSVVFNLNGNKVRTESSAPYALYGDSNGNYNGYNLGNGQYTLEASPYSERSGQGDQGQSYKVVFTLY